jgi:arylamine N-acetyltransferase
MQSNVASVENSLYRRIVTACIAPSAGRKSLLKKHVNALKNTGIRKRSTVTIVKEKVIVLQQFFLQNQAPWYSKSFLRERKELTVTILAEKLEKDT